MLVEVRYQGTDTSWQSNIKKLPVKLRFPDGLSFGEIESIDNRVDPTTGTLEVRAEFANKEQGVVPSLNVTTIIAAPSVEQVMLIPQRVV